MSPFTIINEYGLDLLLSNASFLSKFHYTMCSARINNIFHGLGQVAAVGIFLT